MAEFATTKLQNYLHSNNFSKHKFHFTYKKLAKNLS